MHRRHLAKPLGLTVLAVISVMAMSSTAQAKWLILLNNVSIKTATGDLKAFLDLLEAENGLKIHCTGGTGKASVELKNEDKIATGSVLGILEGCVWVGSEKTCTIDEGLGAGKIHAQGTAELTMVGSEIFALAKSTAGTPLAVIETEGAFCTIPEEEEVTGAIICKFLDPLTASTLKLCHLELDPSEALKLGGSKVKKLEVEVHVTDLNPNATFAGHLVNL